MSGKFKLMTQQKRHRNGKTVHELRSQTNLFNKTKLSYFHLRANYSSSFELNQFKQL